MLKFNLVRAIVLVFFASACGMVIELIAGRILAPYIGVSLYTWTSIIGIVLAGISIGNYLGGRIGDRFTSPLVLSVIFFVGSIFCLTILPITGLLRSNPLPTSFHIMGRATIYSVALFFLPSAFLGMVTPLVIKQTLKDLGRTGNVVGGIYAISCVGSILGTFLTGFFLISRFGTRLIVWEVAGVLFLMALFSSGLWRSKVKWSLAAATLIVFVLVFYFRDSFQTSFLRESNYYSINVYETEDQGRRLKALALDHLIHSFVDINDPKFHGYYYEKTFAAVTSYVARDKPGIATLLIGGGGYSFSRYLEATYPGASIEVAEIDPAVTEIAYSQLGLPPDSRIVTHNTDARIFLIDRNISGKYDLVYGDAFNDKSVPYHLTTFEFNQKLKAAMKPDGFYVVNLIDDLTGGRFVRSFMETLGQSFKNTYLFLAGTADLKTAGTSTYVVLATNRDFDPSELMAVINSNAAEFGVGRLVSLAEVEQALGESGVLVLTDDYVPVDNMLAPLFNAH